MARWIVAGLVVADGRNRSRARLTAVVRVARKSGRENGLGGHASKCLMAADMRGCCRESGIPAQAHSEYSEYLCCVRGRSSYCTPLDPKHLSFERRICKESAGEGWQPQRSGQLDFTPRPPAHFGRRQDKSSPGGGDGQPRGGGYCPARDHRRQNG